MQKKLCNIENFSVHLETERFPITPVDKVSFTIHEKEIIGIVGESGSGKSVLCQSIMRLLEKDTPLSYSGSIDFQGKDILQLSNKELCELRGKEISMIFQNAFSALNPLYSIKYQLGEAFFLNSNYNKKEIEEKSIALLEHIGFTQPEKVLKQYPHELSGGMQQRIMIAMAIACNPQLLIADEPTTALDVHTQSEVLDLLKQINIEYAMAILFVTHNIILAASLCDTVFVMYLGQVVEKIPANELLTNAKHPYTKGLLNALPQFSEERLIPIQGSVPSFMEVPEGCRFYTRCKEKTSLCELDAPWVKINNRHFVRCWKYDEKNERGL